jgi:hypothetical protein
MIRAGWQARMKPVELQRDFLRDRLAGPAESWVLDSGPSWGRDWTASPPPSSCSVDSTSLRCTSQGERGFNSAGMDRILQDRDPPRPTSLVHTAGTIKPLVNWLEQAGAPPRRSRAAGQPRWPRCGVSMNREFRIWQLPRAATVIHRIDRNLLTAAVGQKCFRLDLRCAAFAPSNKVIATTAIHSGATKT